MTAIIALENKDPDDIYRVSNEDLVGENSMGLEAGEVLTLEDLLYGLMLPSGNDAAEVLANNFPGGREAFIQAMNNKAKSLGLTDTHFTNPSGLQGENIPLVGRIVAVADVFDALSHERPYKAAWPLAEVMAEIESQRGLQFDPRVVEAFQESTKADG